MVIDPLPNHPQAIPVIAQWYFDEWGHIDSSITAQDIVEDLAAYTQRVALPQALVALEGDAVLGVAELKIREVSFLPQYEHWMGGLYVNPDHRGLGIGDELVCRIIDMAHRQYAINTLYLQTERLDGGLYVRHGWSGIDTITVKKRQRLIMANSLSQRIQPTVLTPR